MQERSASPAWRAAGWMGGAMVFFLSMALSGRELSRELNTFQVLFFRSLVGLVIITVLLQHHGWHLMRSKVKRTHLLRNCVHFAGQYGWFYGLALIPLTEVFALEFTMPIWTALLAPMVLGERMTATRALVVGIGFLGTLIVLRPGLAVVHPAALAVLGSALAYSFAHMMTKRLSSRDAPLTILFYMTVMQLPMGFITSLSHWVWPSLSAWPWIVLIGFAALAAHYCMTRALQLADATVVMPMDFLRLPLIAAVGYLFYGEKLDLWVLVGALVLCVGAWVNLRGAER